MAFGQCGVLETRTNLLRQHATEQGMAAGAVPDEDTRHRLQ